MATALAVLREVNDKDHVPLKGGQIKGLTRGAPVPVPVLEVVVGLEVVEDEVGFDEVDETGLVLVELGVNSVEGVPVWQTH